MGNGLGNTPAESLKRGGLKRGMGRSSATAPKKVHFIRPPPLGKLDESRIRERKGKGAVKEQEA